jgi:site-specific DNA-cytosine methylase
MVAPRCLDLFCGAGGAAMGYARAGFAVQGVDRLRQRHELAQAIPPAYTAHLGRQALLLLGGRA